MFTPKTQKTHSAYTNFYAFFSLVTSQHVPTTTAAATFSSPPQHQRPPNYILAAHSSTTPAASTDATNWHLDYPCRLDRRHELASSNLLYSGAIVSCIFLLEILLLSAF